MIKIVTLKGAPLISVGAKLRYMGYFASLLHLPGRIIWLLFSVRDMSWGLRNPCFTKFFVVNFLQMACNQRYPTNIENSSTQNTRLIIYFIIVSMNLSEVSMFDLVININCRCL